MAGAEGVEVHVDASAYLRAKCLGDTAAKAFQPRQRHALAERDVFNFVQYPILPIGVNDLNIGLNAESGLENGVDFFCSLYSFHGRNLANNPC